MFCYQAAEYEGIKIFHYNSSIYFANSDLYVNALKEKVTCHVIYGGSGILKHFY